MTAGDEGAAPDLVRRCGDLAMDSTDDASDTTVRHVIASDILCFRPSKTFAHLHILTLF